MSDRPKFGLPPAPYQKQPTKVRIHGKTGKNTVADVIDILGSFPQDAEVWMDVDGRVDRPVMAYLDDDGDVMLQGRP